MLQRIFAVTISFFLLSALLLTGCRVKGETSSAAETDYTGQIDKTEIMTFNISVDEAAWQEMLANAEAEVYIPADVTINGTTVKNVGIRPKGNSSLSQVSRDDTTDRFSFKIKFDEYVDGQTWLGLDKIVVNNMFSDATYMKEYLSYDIMSYIGVEAPLYAFADIQVNGETWGFYLAVEDIEESYLERVYDGEGELYKPDSMDGQRDNAGGNIGGAQERPDFQNGSGNFGQNGKAPQGGQPQNGAGAIPDVNTADSGQTPNGNMPQGAGFGGGMAQNGVSLQYTDDNVASYSAIFDNAETDADESDYQRVITALKNLNSGTDLETYVDVDAVLKYFAAHTAVVNLDSYVSNMGHNYYLYENNGQLTILPWDYNLAFGGFQSGSASDIVNFPIDTPVSGVSMEDRPLLNQLLQVSEYKEKYHEYLQQIVSGYFTDGKFEQTVDKLDSLISEYVKNDPTAFYTFEAYKAALTELKTLGALRAVSIQGQLDGTVPSTAEAQESSPDALLDASSIDMTALGSQGGGKGMPQNPGGNKPSGF